MSDRFLVIVPTRGRPGNVRRLTAGLAETGTSVADFLFVVDDDDPTTPEYLALADSGPHRFAVVHRMRLGGTLNFIAAQHLDEYAAIGFMGDDHLPRTAGWDTSILEALDAPGPRVVYGNDLLQGANLPTAVFLHSAIIRALGYMCPPRQLHLFLDDFWKALGEQLGGLVYLPDVIIEHLHPVAQKAIWDERYAEVNSQETTESDRDAWLRYWADPGPDGFGAALGRVREAYGA